MFFKPKKSREIYKLTIAHRGYHKNCVENSMSAYMEALKRNLAIEADIRMLKDGRIVCFHDKHLKRLLGVKESINTVEYTKLQGYYLVGSNEKVPRFEQLLDMVSGKVELLLEVKGYLNKRFKRELLRCIENYNGKIFFHTTNILTYFILRKIYKDKVFFVLNPFRKRFGFIKFP